MQVQMPNPVSSGPRPRIFCWPRDCFTIIFLIHFLRELLFKSITEDNQASENPVILTNIASIEHITEANEGMYCANFKHTSMTLQALSTVNTLFHTFSIKKISNL